MMPGIRIETLTPRDAAACAQIHSAAFPGFFLTNLGTRALQELYRFYAKDPATLGVTARDPNTGDVLGFAVGSFNPNKTRRRMAYRGSKLAYAVICDNWRNARVLKASLRRVLPNSLDKSVNMVTRNAPYLASLAVEPTVQARGIGSRLVEEWIRQVEGRGGQQAWLTTDAVRNDKTRAFYERQGWAWESDYTTCEGRTVARYIWTHDRPPPKRILHVVSGSDFGGASKIIAEIGTAAVRAGNHVGIYTTEQRLGAMAKQAGIAVHSTEAIERRLRPMRDAKAVIDVRRVIRGHNYQVIHVHTFKGSLVGRLAALTAGRQSVVYSLHNFAYARDASALSKLANYITEGVLAKATTRLVTVSDTLCAEATAHGIRARSGNVSIRNGIPDTANLAALEGQADALRVIYHGRLDHGKGLDCLIRGVTKAAKTIPIRLDVYGEGPLRAELERAVYVLGSGHLVYFHGFVDDMTVPLSCSDVAVQPSSREGLSIALLEAMRAQICVLASDIPANSEVLGPDLREALFPYNDVDELARKLVSAWHHPAERHLYAVRARKRYLSSFTSERMTREYLELYAKLPDRR